MANVVAGGNAGLMTGTDKTKLDGIAAGAVADHVNIANKGTNTHTQIDTFVASKAAASGLASLDANSKVVQNGQPGFGGSAVSALTPGSTVAMNFTNGSVFTLTPAQTCTINASGGTAGMRATLVITTSGTASYTITFGTGFKSTGTLATGTVTGKKFCISFVYDGTNYLETSRTAAM